MTIFLFLRLKYFKIIESYEFEVLLITGKSHISEMNLKL